MDQQNTPIQSAIDFLNSEIKNKQWIQGAVMYREGIFDTIKHLEKMLPFERIFIQGVYSYGRYCEPNGSLAEIEMSAADYFDETFKKVEEAPGNIDPAM